MHTLAPGRGMGLVAAVAVLAAGALGCSGSETGAAGPSADAGNPDSTPSDDASSNGGDSTVDSGGGSTDGAQAGEDGASSGGDAAGDAHGDGDTTDAGASDAEVADGGWLLVWSDEFDGDGGAPDPAKWTFTSLNTTTSGPGWGTEYDEPAAVKVGGGLLTITATKAADGGVVSGAMDSKGKFQQTYGRFEARMKAPPGAGVWPAFWLMGDTNGQGWPTCGEIDIVEIVGSAPKSAYATVHSGNTSNASQNTSTGGVFTASADQCTDFHVYAVEWSASRMDFYVDTNLYETVTPTTLTSGEVWAFDHAFYVMFDLAIGGSWAGAPNASTFPAPMQVDYVRVYTKGS